MADADALRAQIGQTMVRLIAEVVLHNHVVAARMGLGPSDSQFMTLLDVHGPLTPGRLAGLTGLTSGSVTAVIDRLERAGFVHRQRDQADRRRVLVMRDDQAVTTHMAPHYAEHGERLRALLDKRDAAELTVIADFLGEIVDPS